jgi:hypothetical protein
MRSLAKMPTLTSCYQIILRKIMIISLKEINNAKWTNNPLILQEIKINQFNRLVRKKSI